MFSLVWCLLFLNMKNIVLTTELCSVTMSCLLLYQLQRSTCLSIVLRFWVLKDIPFLPPPSFLQDATQFTSSGHGSRLHVSVLWSQSCFYCEGSFPLPNQRPVWFRCLWLKVLLHEFPNTTGVLISRLSYVCPRLSNNQVKRRIN